MLILNQIGNMTFSSVNSSIPIAPVINIKSEYAEKMIGTGIATNPYRLEEQEFNVPKAVKAIKNNKVPNNVNEGSPNFANVATRDEGVYSMEDDYGTSYYFRGAVDNNYVKFAEFYWRIIRINGDGSLRIQYDGTKAYANGESNVDRVAFNSAWNTSYNDNKYAGYMYGGEKGVSSSTKEEAQLNETNSDIKLAIDTWYKNNIEDKNYSKYLTTEAIYCNDRSVADVKNNWDVRDTALGYGQNFTVYGSTNRLIDTSNISMWSNKIDAKPNLKCPYKGDAFTTSNSEKGNKKLNYPIGLITADELVLAGAINHEGTSISNNRLYLSKGVSYWTMSPRVFDGGVVGILILNQIGNMSGSYANSSIPIAPVVNIKSEYAEKMKGTGYMSDPYTIE